MRPGYAYRQRSTFEHAQRACELHICAGLRRRFCQGTGKAESFTSGDARHISNIERLSHVFCNISIQALQRFGTERAIGTGLRLNHRKAFSVDLKHNSAHRPKELNTVIHAGRSNANRSRARQVLKMLSRHHVLRKDRLQVHPADQMILGRPLQEHWIRIGSTKKGHTIASSRTCPKRKMRVDALLDIARKVEQTRREAELLPYFCVVVGHILHCQST